MAPRARTCWQCVQQRRAWRPAHAGLSAPLARHAAWAALSAKTVPNTSLRAARYITRQPDRSAHQNDQPTRRGRRAPTWSSTALESSSRIARVRLIALPCAAHASARGPRSADPRRPRGAQEAGSPGRRAGERAAPWQVDPNVCSIAPCVPAPHTPTHAPQPPPARPRARPRRAGARAAATGEDVGAGSHGAADEDRLAGVLVIDRDERMVRGKRAGRTFAVNE